MIDIYYMDATQIRNEVFEKYYNILQKERQKKIDRYKRIEDKKLSLAAGMLLRAALQKNDIHYESAFFSVTDKGKIYLKNQENRLYFNISHSGDYSVVAISDKEVGVDIQKIKKYNDKVVERCFTQREKLDFYKTEERKKEDAFATIWAIKESYLKAIGIGITEDMNGFETDYQDDEECGCIVQIKESIKKTYPSANIKVLKDIQGYIISLCCFDNIEKIGVIQMKPENF